VPNVQVGDEAEEKLSPPTGYQILLFMNMYRILGSHGPHGS
jgi:hypothetical protein